MQTTYSQIHKSMECPVCGKTLIESISQNKVACQNPECNFNKEWIVGADYAGKNSKDLSCRVFGRKNNGKVIIEKVEYF